MAYASLLRKTKWSYSGEKKIGEMSPLFPGEEEYFRSTFLLITCLQSVQRVLRFLLDRLFLYRVLKKIYEEVRALTFPP